MKNLSWENSRHFATSQLVSQRNDVCGTSAEIPYWWRHTTQIRVVLLIGWKFDSLVSPSRENQWLRRKVSTVSQARKAKYRNLNSAVLWYFKYREGCSRREWQRAQEKRKLSEVYKVQSTKDEKKRKDAPANKWGRGKGEEERNLYQSTGEV